MPPLDLRQHQTVADPLQSERLLQALTLLLAHQEQSHGSCPLGACLAPSATTRGDQRESTAPAPASSAAPRVGAAARAGVYG